MCIMSQKIRDVAQKTKIPCLQGSMSVSAAIEIMDMYEINIVAVECENDFAGIFSRGDFNRNVIRQNLRPDETTLYEVMSLNAPSVSTEHTVKETYEAMLTCQWEHMPVLEGRKLLGVVSMCDIGKDVIKSFEDTKTENEMIMKYIQCGESYAMANYAK